MNRNVLDYFDTATVLATLAGKSVLGKSPLSSFLAEIECTEKMKEYARQLVD